MASGRSHFTLRAAISASSAATVTLSCLPAMFMPTVNSSIMAASFRQSVGRDARFGLLELREPHLQNFLRRHLAVAVFLDEDELLGIGEAGRNDHFPASFQLMDQRRGDECGGNEVGSRRHDHLVEWSVLGPAVIAVGDLELDVGAALLTQSLLCLLGELFDDFDAVNFACQLREDRGLVAQSSADLEHG